MKISIYELLGLIKEGKAPNKIKYGNAIYKKHKRNYKAIDTPDLYLFDFDFFECCRLDDEIEVIEEIIEEEKEIEKKIEKIIISMDDTSMPYVTNNKYQKLSYSEVDLLFASKINELIDVINDMRDKEC